MITSVFYKSVFLIVSLFFLNYGPGRNSFAEKEITGADFKSWHQFVSALQLHHFFLLLTSICSPNLLHWTFNMCWGCQTFPGSSFQHHAVYLFSFRVQEEKLSFSYVYQLLTSPLMPCTRLKLSKLVEEICQQLVLIKIFIGIKQH